MRISYSLIVASLLAFLPASCDDGVGQDHDSGAARIGRSLGVVQIPPPVAIASPPADASKTTSGLFYKKTVVVMNDTKPTPTNTVLVNYTGWRQNTGATFFTTRGRGAPIAINLAQASPSFKEALQLLQKGERMIMWVPPGEGAPEPLVYEIEVADIVVPRAERAARPLPH